jgi:hypothetical protein
MVQMMAALALAETTPGPLIVVLALVGFWPGTITSTVYYGWLRWACWQQCSTPFYRVSSSYWP